MFDDEVFLDVTQVNHERKSVEIRAPIRSRIVQLRQMAASAFLAAAWMLVEPVFALRAALEIPLLGDPPRAELENSFPRSEDPDTPYFRQRHVEQLERWRATQLEGLLRKLDKYASELDTVDHELEVNLGAKVITQEEYAALKSQLDSAKKQLQPDANWHSVYREYLERYKSDIRAYKQSSKGRRRQR
jgi:hypothetical protein